MSAGLTILFMTPQARWVNSLASLFALALRLLSLTLLSLPMPLRRLVVCLCRRLDVLLIVYAFVLVLMLNAMELFTCSLSVLRHLSAVVSLLVSVGRCFLSRQGLPTLLSETVSMSMDRCVLVILAQVALA